MVGKPLKSMIRSANGTAFNLVGERQNPTVVMIHGLGLNHAMWQAYITAFAANYHVLTYDLYGHGKSVAPPTTPSLSMYSHQLIEILDELDIMQCSIVGFSLGGMINRHFTMKFADRVRALIILNSPHERVPDEQQRVEARARQTQEGGPAATLETTIKRWFTAEFCDRCPEMIDQVRNWVLNNDSTVYTQCRWVLANGVRELVRPQPPIGKPTLVATSENDSGSTPTMTYSIASEIDGAKTVVVPQLQHLGVLEKPDLFIAMMLEFLENIECQQ